MSITLKKEFKEDICVLPIMAMTSFFLSHQVMRYQRGGKVLWVSSDGLPQSHDIPRCVCGAPRVFEFQVGFLYLSLLLIDLQLLDSELNSIKCIHVQSKKSIQYRYNYFLLDSPFNLQIHNILHIDWQWYH